MKFRKIRFENHPILGNCNFDFTDKNGNTVDTIIIAGENGCGKTVLLNELFAYSPNEIIGNKTGKFESEIELNRMEIESLNTKVSDIFPEGLPTNIIKVVQDYSIINNWNQVEIYVNDRSFEGYKFALRNLYKKIYSDVEINFTPRQINSVTATNIDQIKNILRSSSNLSTEITQLLIDIKTLDDGDLSDWVSNNPGAVPPEEIQSVRMKRFTTAFHSMFENKRFKGIVNDGGGKKIMFEEFGKTMPIDQLSSGEKQIVFRGGFLLKDKKSIEGAYVLVDEPEISLHPKWQLEILPFIKKLFTNENGEQTSQIIITTHSPFIIHNSNRNKDKVIVLQKNNTGKISVAENPEYYSWSSSQLINEAFNVNLDLRPNCINVFLEGETDELYYNKAVDVYGIDKNAINFSWVGRNIKKGKPENTGDKALNSAASFFKANPQMQQSHIVLLYDCDTHKPEEDINQLHLRTMQNNPENTLYKIGVENLLTLPEGFNSSLFYSESKRNDEYGAESIIRTLDKAKLCTYVCSFNNDELKTIFGKIKKEIDRILSIR